MVDTITRRSLYEVTPLTSSQGVVTCNYFEGKGGVQIIYGPHSMSLSAFQASMHAIIPQQDVTSVTLLGNPAYADWLGSTSNPNPNDYFLHVLKGSDYLQVGAAEPLATLEALAAAVVPTMN
jgi:hypothetical protein